MTTNGNKGYYFEDLAVGMEASYAKKITNDDVLAFAELSGDKNPVHLDDAYAAGTMFKQRIAHGFLTASLFSTVLGTDVGVGPQRVARGVDIRAEGRTDIHVWSDAGALTVSSQARPAPTTTS